MLDRTLSERNYYAALAALDTDAQRSFVIAYLPANDRRMAARAAGCQSEEASAQTSFAKRYLANSKVRKAIDAGKTMTLAKIVVDAERIQQEYAKLAFMNAGDLIEWRNEEWDVDTDSLVQAAGWYWKKGIAPTLDTMASISEIKETPQGLVVKFFNKKDALDALAKMGGYNAADRLAIEGGPEGGNAIPLSVAVHFVNPPKYDDEGRPIPGTGDPLPPKKSGD